MLKYTNVKVVFAEVPNEITLAIELSNCPYHCPACHSKELWEDIGTPLRIGKLCDLVTENKGITCICFMGGDSDLEELYNIFRFCPLLFKDLKIGWYTGRDKIPIGMPEIDYIKIGPYKEECGPINNPSTNQRFYMNGRVMNKMSAYAGSYYDRTDLFWKNDTNS